MSPAFVNSWFALSRVALPCLAYPTLPFVSLSLTYVLIDFLATHFSARVSPRTYLTLLSLFWLFLAVFRHQDKKKRDKENASNENADDGTAKGDVE